MSQRQSEAIKAWWAKRFANGEATRRDLDKLRARDRVAKRRYREASPEKFRLRLRAWYAANRDAVLARRRAVYAVNIEKHRERDRQRRQANRDAMNAIKREKYEQDQAERERALAANTRWREKNRERVRANARRRDALKAATKIGPVDYTAILKDSGNVCGICGDIVDTTNPKAYHFDHKIPLARGGAHTQDNLQLAHATCNMKKHAKVA